MKSFHDFANVNLGRNFEVGRRCRRQISGGAAAPPSGFRERKPAWRFAVPFLALIAVLAAWLVLLPAGRSAEPAVDPKDLPRIRPVEPRDALKTFKIKPGFHLELAASEPLVADPIEMCFDENGRLFVVEMIDYSERRDEQPHLGRIRLLEDTDEDGHFDKSTVYAEDLPWPTALFCYDGGLFVGAEPDLFYCKDTNGDGVADTRRVVFTGFGITGRLNMQAMFNSFRWGLDNRIHGAAAPMGGTVISPLTPQQKPLDLRGRDFAFDPRTWAITSEAGGGQYGMCFDDRGRRFVCSNSDHIRVFMYDDRYAARNPFLAMPSPVVSIADDGPAAEVYRLSPEEPWRVMRTQWRVGGLVPGPIEGGGRASGYFTSATGLTIYRGDAFPEEYQGDAFIADCGSNLVHRKKLYPEGVALVAKRPPGEEKVEFLASTDLWFRPVQFANAPDGTLYMADMYREVIEHPWSLPESIKQHLDLNSGHDRGRIYRIVPDGFKQPKLPRLGKAGVGELVATLAHPNAWHRETAARLLYERQDKSAVPALEKLLTESKLALGRMHALHALDGLQALAEAHILQGLKDADDRVREHAVLLSERLFAKGGAMSDTLWNQLKALTADTSIHVRYQLAFTLGEIRRPGRAQALAEIIRHDVASGWVQAAVLSSLAEGTGEMFATLVAEARFHEAAAGQEFLRQLVLVIGTKNQPGEVAQILDYIETNARTPLALSLIRALGGGLQRAKSSLDDADKQGKLKPIYAQAASLIADDKVADALRVEAVQLLGLTSFAEAGDRLLSLLDPTQSQAVQLAAMSTVARFRI